MANKGLTVKKQFELFVNRVEMLKNTRLIRDGKFNFSCNIHFEINKELKINFQEPDEDDLRSLLLTFRQFISQREPIFLDKVFNSSYQYVNYEQFKKEIIEIKKLWTDEKNSFMTFIKNDKNLSTEQVTDCWINAFYFHNDTEKMLILKGMNYYERVMIRSIFLNYLIQTCKCILCVGDILKKVLGKIFLQIQNYHTEYQLCCIALFFVL